jgi:hypothetical protein
MSSWAISRPPDKRKKVIAVKVFPIAFMVFDFEYFIYDD